MEFDATPFASAGQVEKSSAFIRLATFRVSFVQALESLSMSKESSMDEVKIHGFAGSTYVQTVRLVCERRCPKASEARH